ncbi:hypothetical protein GGH94_004424 [Coemansia aciculifera]|uniref:Uncharacterized protein n=1 Tax=Coemansia aciculifera TaxID=417176 RepID=A0A9W8INH1_9FUNG|nr:hypothetical protein GGH94_004424 [Coemansia aciculifera]KAJ2871957.1 hypothetical protein GGH93_004407 [Coemansia aciculifera]
MSASTATTMTPEQRVSKVFELLENSGKKEYVGGNMTQLDHALRVAYLAKREGADEETILAGLLLSAPRLSFEPALTNDSSNTRDKKQTVHRPTGQVPDFLTIDRYEADDFSVRKLGFSTKTCELVESNVMAKRYLSTIDPGYGDYTGSYTVIFDAVPRSPLSPTEMREFEKDPLFKPKVQLAKWDAAATKTTDIKPPALDTYRDMAIRNILMSMRTLY